MWELASSYFLILRLTCGTADLSVHCVCSIRFFIIPGILWTVNCRIPFSLLGLLEMLWMLIPRLFRLGDVIHLSIWDVSFQLQLDYGMSFLVVLLNLRNFRGSKLVLIDTYWVDNCNLVLLLFKYILYYIVFLSFFPSFLFIFSSLGLPSLLVPSGSWHFALSVRVCSLVDSNNNNNNNNKRLEYFSSVLCTVFCGNFQLSVMIIIPQHKIVAWNDVLIYIFRTYVSAFKLCNGLYNGFYSDAGVSWDLHRYDMTW